MPLLSRSSDLSLSTSSPLFPIYVAGLSVAIAVLGGLCFWVSGCCRCSRAKNAERSKAPYIFNSSTSFSRDNLTESVTLPRKAIIRPSSIGIVDYQKSSDPFLTDNQSVFTYSDNTLSMKPKAANESLRKILQTYTPILPDELLVSLGESLTLVQSFDDGWCVVGRDKVLPTSNSFSNTGASTPEDVELGVIPEWCFAPPVSGILMERPIRSSSLGITAHKDSPRSSSRDEILSWSNF